MTTRARTFDTPEQVAAFLDEFRTNQRREYETKALLNDVDPDHIDDVVGTFEREFSECLRTFRGELLKTFPDLVPQILASFPDLNDQDDL